VDLVSLKDWSTADILTTVDMGIALKQDPSRYAKALEGRTLGLLFQKTSTRTRCAGEIGIFQLGGQAVYLDWSVTNFSLADLGDEIRVLSSYVDFILARLLKHEDVVISAAASSVPLMNGCCNRYHPLQALTDLQSIKERMGRLEGVKLVFVGPYNNVCNSLVAAALKVGMEVKVVAPEIDEKTIDRSLLEALEAAGGGLSEDLRGTLETSDVVYTDTWIDMEYFLDPAFAAERERRVQKFVPYQLNAELLAGLNIQIMHCLPAHRGYEIDGDLLDDPRSIMFDQAENRLHSQKAVLLKLAGRLD
jgi:ornithine carbamoyltransferase